MISLSLLSRHNQYSILVFTLLYLLLPHPWIIYSFPSYLWDDTSISHQQTIPSLPSEISSFRIPLSKRITSNPFISSLYIKSSTTATDTTMKDGPNTDGKVSQINLLPDPSGYNLYVSERIFHMIFLIWYLNFELKDLMYFHLVHWEKKI